MITAQTVEAVLVGAVLVAATYAGLDRLRWIDAPVRWQVGLTLVLVVVALSQQHLDAEFIALAGTTVSTYLQVLMWVLGTAVAVFFPVHLSRRSGSRALHRTALVWSAVLWWGLVAALTANALASLAGSCGPGRTTVPTGRTTVMCEANVGYGFLWALLVVVLNLATLVGAYVVRRQQRRRRPLP